MRFMTRAIVAIFAILFLLPACGDDDRPVRTQRDGISQCGAKTCQPGMYCSHDELEVCSPGCTTDLNCAHTHTCENIHPTLGTGVCERIVAAPSNNASNNDTNNINPINNDTNNDTNNTTPTNNETNNTSPTNNETNNTSPTNNDTNNTSSHDCYDYCYRMIQCEYMSTDGLSECFGLCDESEEIAQYIGECNSEAETCQEALSCYG